ncbi:MarR family transcriptional regulator [Clostridium sp.]|uniref:MarR family transcriptional regulator n=1 Tax=Clostridium sp. TaxID=1506 RepID=UPI0028422B88|nr:MarR family transcriptional regulator [Clostridium sp.]MDR3598264.1 MarR family transcriptional regulator [Clostridium sp.]
MDNYLKDLNLVDLVSEKHKKLRKEVMKLWAKQHEEYISDSEAHMLGTINIKEMTVAEIARKMNISRQGAHKCAKKLIDSGYIIMKSIEGNNRDKLLVLTKKGESYCNEMLILKKQVEDEVIKNIGYKNVESLKEFLRKDWMD